MVATHKSTLVTTLSDLLMVAPKLLSTTLLMLKKLVLAVSVAIVDIGTLKLIFPIFMEKMPGDGFANVKRYS